MQLKTDLSVKEFRTRFAHQVSPEYAAGIHSTDEGMWISGKTTKTDFIFQITRPAASSLLDPQAIGKMTPTDDGCNVSWKIRRPRGAMIALGVSSLLAAAAMVPTGLMTYLAAVTAWVKEPALWGQVVFFTAITLACLVGLIFSLRILFYIPKKKRERLDHTVRQIIGEEHIIE